MVTWKYIVAFTILCGWYSEITIPIKITDWTKDSPGHRQQSLNEIIHWAEKNPQTSTPNVEPTGSLLPFCIQYKVAVLLHGVQEINNTLRYHVPQLLFTLSLSKNIHRLKSHNHIYNLGHSLTLPLSKYAHPSTVIKTAYSPFPYPMSSLKLSPPTSPSTSWPRPSTSSPSRRMPSYDESLKSWPGSWDVSSGTW